MKERVGDEKLIIISVAENESEALAVFCLDILQL